MQMKMKLATLVLMASVVGCYSQESRPMASAALAEENIFSAIDYPPVFYFLRHTVGSAPCVLRQPTPQVSCRVTF